MEVYGECLIFVVFILLFLIFCQQTILYFETKKEKKDKENNNIENFDNSFITYVQEMNPYEGDSSSVIKLKGIGFDLVSKVFFKNIGNYAQAIILDNRKNNLIEIIPPSLSELGLNIQDVRENIKENKEGIKVSLVFIRKEKDESGNLIESDAGTIPEDKKNVVEVPNLFFYYIDLLPYKNNCPKPPSPPEIITEYTSPPIVSEPEFREGSDLEYIYQTLNNKKQKIDDLYDELYQNTNKIMTMDDNNIKKLQTEQAIQSVDEMNKKLNYERLYIQTNLNDKYKMGLNYDTYLN